MNKKKIYTLIEFSLLFICLVTGCISQNSTKELPDQSEETKIVTFASFPQPVLGIVIDSDGKILYVEPGSASERAGLVSGDILISLDGFSVTLERDKVRELIRSNTEEMKMEIQYQRGENVILTQITPSQKIQNSDDQTPKLTPTPVLPPEDYLELITLTALQLEGLAFSKNVALVYLDLFQVSSTFQTFIGSSFSSSKPIMDGLLLGNTISLVQMVSNLHPAIMVLNIHAFRAHV